jgi:hypothetical protein
MGEKQSGAHAMPPFPPSVITAFLQNPRENDLNEDRRLASSRSSRRARRRIVLRERSSGRVSVSTTRKIDSTTA